MEPADLHLICQETAQGIFGKCVIVGYMMFTDDKGRHAFMGLSFDDVMPNHPIIIAWSCRGNIFDD